MRRKLSPLLAILTTGICENTLMNGYWEALIGKVEDFLHATNDLDNYCMNIQQNILYSSGG